MADVYLVCEGPADGLDVRVLDAIVAQKLGLAVQVIPCGGSASLSSVRGYLEDRSRKPKPDGTLRPPVDRALAIEDRNFLPRARAEEGWNDARSRKLMWRRHEIESYLLEPRVVFSAFTSLRQTVAQPWIRSLPGDEAAAAALLARLATSRLEHHVGQVLAAELLSATGEAGSTRFRQPPGSSKAGACWPRAAWLSALREEAVRVGVDCDSVAALPALDPASIEARYDAILQDVLRPEFIGRRDYLTEMGGHELLRALVAEFRERGADKLSTEALESELVNALEREYQPGALFQPDDFASLRDRLLVLGAKAR